MDEQTVDRIFAGSLVDLPPVSSKIVRIFTSSTFPGDELVRYADNVAIIGSDFETEYSE